MAHKHEISDTLRAIARGRLGAQTIAAGALRGLNDTRVPLIFAGISFWLVGFTGCWLFGFTFGLGALEGIDRLLFVTDREQGPLTQGADAGAGEELLGQGRKDLPLVRGGVLGFVKQDVINAAVQPTAGTLKPNRGSRVS